MYKKPELQRIDGPLLSAKRQVERALLELWSTAWTLGVDYGRRSPTVTEDLDATGEWVAVALDNFRDWRYGSCKQPTFRDIDLAIVALNMYLSTKVSS